MSGQGAHRLDRLDALRDFIDARIGQHFDGAPPRAVLDLDGALRQLAAR